MKVTFDFKNLSLLKITASYVVHLQLFSMLLVRIIKLKVPLTAVLNKNRLFSKYILFVLYCSQKLKEIIIYYNEKT